MRYILISLMTKRLLNNARKKDEKKESETGRETDNMSDFNDKSALFRTVLSRVWDFGI